MSIFKRISVAVSAAVVACCFLGFSTLTAQSQAWSRERVAFLMIDFKNDAAAICLNPERKVADLNYGNTLLAALRSEKDPAQAGQLEQYLYDIRSKPPCNTVRIYYTGGYVLKDTSDQHIEEILSATGQLTNRFHLVKDPIGAGIDGGYYYSPWNNNVRVGPFLSFGVLHLPVYQTFAGGNFLGTTTNWIGIAGLKAGTMTSPDLFLYGLTGVSLVNEDVRILLGGPLTSQNKTVPGFSLGLGAEYQPANWQAFGRPLAVFAEYSHTWWQTVHLNAPAASPPFNYTFKREDDTFKLGFHIYFQ